MKYKILMLVVVAMLMVGSIVPALAAQRRAPCEWDWDRYLWRAYHYELWTCWSQDENNAWHADAFWTPDWGYWYPNDYRD